MMKIYKFIVVASILLATSCAIWKKNLSPAGGLTAIIHNVITDFENTSKLFDRDSVFSVMVTDMDNYYIVGIGGVVNKIYPQKKEIIGVYDETLPNKYVIRKGKLFYWTEPNEKISEKIIDILTEYDQLDFNWRDEHDDLPPLKIDDGKDGIVYYICKNNIIRYKKTGTNTLKKHFKIPHITCK